MPLLTIGNVSRVRDFLFESCRVWWCRHPKFELSHCHHRQECHANPRATNQGGLVPAWSQISLRCKGQVRNLTSQASAGAQADHLRETWTRPYARIVPF